MIEIEQSYHDDGKYRCIDNNASVILNNFTQSFTFVGSMLKADMLTRQGKVGDIIVTSDTQEIFAWIGDTWDKIEDVENVPEKESTKKRTKKIIPHPVLCNCCGAPMHDYKCDHCGAEYPSFEYIMEEEEY